MSTKVKDPNGKIFESVTEMCNYYGIRLDTFSVRIKRGWTLQQALRPVAKRGKNTVPIDHLGNRYKSLKEMCEHYNISISIFRHRTITQKKSLEEALTTPPQRKKYKSRKSS